MIRELLGLTQQQVKGLGLWNMQQSWYLEHDLKKGLWNDVLHSLSVMKRHLQDFEVIDCYCFIVLSY